MRWFLNGCDTFKSNKIIVPLRTETTITSDNYMKNMTIDYHKAFTMGKNLLFCILEVNDVVIAVNLNRYF